MTASAGSDVAANFAGPESQPSAMEPDKFQDFLQKGPERASRELREQPLLLAAFVRRLLRLALLQGGLPRTDMYVPSADEYTTWLKWLVTWPEEGASPEHYIQRVQDEHGAKSNVCGRIWGKGYVAYRCRTCGMSPCSAICHECFEKGPHRNHNFLMYRSVAGGCCDCGDPGAWKASGFCCDHKGPPESFQLPMPEQELRSAFNCIHDLVSHVAEALTTHYAKRDAMSAADAPITQQGAGSAAAARTVGLPIAQGSERLAAAERQSAADDELPLYCIKTLKLLQDLCTYGDVYRRIVCAATLGDIGLTNSTLRGSWPYAGEPHGTIGSPSGLPQPAMPPAPAPVFQHLPAMAKNASGMSIDDELPVDREEGEPGSLLERLMLSGTYLSVEISTLFLQMLFDFDFKKKFTRVFIRYYGRFMQTILRLHDKKEIPTRMVDISVQLFSNSMLTVQMIREEALLSTLFRNIMALMPEQADPSVDSTLAHATLNCEHPIWTKRTYWPITNDLVNILSHRAVVSEFLFRVDIVTEWLAVARRFQSIDVHKREVRQHVEIENRHWTSPFFIELELVMEQLSLLDAGVKDILNHPMLPEPGEPVIEGTQIICAMQQILALGIKTCQEWLQSDAVGAQWGAFHAEGSESGVLPMRFRVSQQPVTLHIPLHRFVAFFASQVCRQCDSPLPEILPVQDSPSFIRALVEHPLRIQVLLAQIRAGMWRLNGETMFRRGWFYRSAYFYDLGFDLDLFLLQCAAVLLPTDELLLTLIDRFALVDYLGFSDPRPNDDADMEAENSLPSNEPDVCTVITEDMMVLIAAILSERARLGLTDDECIRQEVIARLCVKPHSHSQLSEAICRRWNEHDKFESVLLEVANFEAPKSHRMEQGKYRLKQEHTEEREGSIVHILVRSFNHGDYEAAVEQIREAEKGEKGGAGEDYVSSRKVERAGSAEPAGGSNSTGAKTLMMPVPPAFRDILHILHSPVLHHVVHRVLSFAVSGKSSTTSVHVDMALWLLQAALEQPLEAVQERKVREGEMAGRWGCIFSSRDIRENMATVVSPEQGNGNEPDVVMSGAGAGDGHSIVSLLNSMQQLERFTDVRPTPASLLALFARGSEGKGGEAKIEHVGVQVSSPDRDVSDSAKKDAMQAAKDRQKALLASFAAQQKLFADTMSDSEEDEAGDQDEEHEERVECVICSQSAAPTEDSPVGLVCLVQQSNLLADQSQKAREDFFASCGLARRQGSAMGETVHANLDSGSNLHFQSCGHHIHVSCFKSYTESLHQNHAMRLFDESRTGARQGFFNCPKCRQLANALVPLLPKGSKREHSSESKRKASALLHNILPQAKADVYLHVTGECSSGRSPPIPLKGVGQMDGQDVVDMRSSYGPPLQGAVKDFFAQLVEIRSTGLDRSDGARAAREGGAGGLEILARGVGMTLGCMEVCARDSSARLLGVQEALVNMQERVLPLVRHMHELTVCTSDHVLPGDGTRHGGSVGEEVLRAMLRLRAERPTGGNGIWGLETVKEDGLWHAGMMHDNVPDDHARAHNDWPLVTQAEEAGNSIDAGQLNGEESSGQARLEVYPTEHDLAGSGSGDALPALRGDGQGLSLGFGDGNRVGPAAASRTRLEAACSEVPFLALEMNSVLLHVVYAMSAADVDEHGQVLFRLVYLALFVQIFVNYHAQRHFREGCQEMAAVVMEQDGPGGESALEALILREMRQLDLPAALVQAWRARSMPAVPAVSDDAAGSPVAGVGGWGAGGEPESLEAYVHKCTLPFLRRARLLLAVHSGNLAIAPARSAAVGLAGEWRACMAALRLPVGAPGEGVMPNIGEYCMDLVQGWLRELDPVRRNGSWPSVWQAFALPQHLGHPLLIPLPDLYHDLYMAYRDHKCRACNLVPHRPALCLICGELVCFGSECCSSVGVPGRLPGGADRDKVFECFSHARQYHGGTGIYVVLKSSMVFVIRNMHCCYWGSPYLDAYGEEDQDLRRGRPLHLNAERYEQLQVLHSTHGFDHDSRVASAWHPGAHRY